METKSKAFAGLGQGLLSGLALILLLPFAEVAMGNSAVAMETESSHQGLDGDALPAVECLALNIYHEARGEPEAGRIAVGHVVLNRAQDSRFPKDVCEVVRQGGEKRRNRCQFSWWCDGRSDEPRDVQAWNDALRLARAIFEGVTSDPTGGALWYHADYVQPAWQNSFERGPSIGRHIFYRRAGAQPASAQLAEVRTAETVMLYWEVE